MKSSKLLACEEERLKFAPGGLDPLEVFESLPEKLQYCFKSGGARDLPAGFIVAFRGLIDSLGCTLISRFRSRKVQFRWVFFSFQDRVFC